MTAELTGFRALAFGISGLERFFSAVMFGVLFLVALSIVSAEASSPVEVRGVRQLAGEKTVRLIFDLSASASYAKGKLANPDRYFIDLKGARLASSCPKTVSVGDKIVKTVRLGRFSAETVRVVLELTTDKYDVRTVPMDEPSRLVVDIGPKGEFSRKPATKPEVPKEHRSDVVPSRIPGSKPEQPRDGADVRRKVVIDAGHGGHDPGAVGKNGLYEKDVVLDIALQAKAVLMKKYPGYDVVLTRDRDVFIPLDKRAEIANRMNADLFVSIHANASTNRKARGMETYLLNWTNDEESLRVAARENAISLKKMRQVQNDVSAMLASLERESKRDESIKLSGFIQNAMVSGISQSYPDTANLGVKQALFYVLVGAKMPSALVEVAFISNAEEERLLTKESYRLKIASAVAGGINDYFLSTPSQKVAVREKKGSAKYAKLKRR
ncbi:MAG TPA: N-acetylmuramoyl-L-alanine amidase [Dissulfurispiraceae bacterium]|nr:N-acetylmuramoyl-L-alanine amidase [Dissulfurispiraceae bacterium]